MGLFVKATIGLVILLLGTFAASTKLNFGNPVLDSPASVAAIIRIRDYYYLAIPERPSGGIQILKSENLSDFNSAEREVVYQLPAGFTDLEPNSFLEHENNLYLYFHLRNVSTHILSVYSIQAETPLNPLGNWGLPSLVLGHAGIDHRHASVFIINDGLFISWAGYVNAARKMNLYIAKMESPLRVVDEYGSLIKTPNYEWECTTKGFCFAEAPSFVQHSDVIYLLYSANAAVEPNACISFMTIQVGLDPLEPANWNHSPNPIFEGKPEEHIYATRLPKITTNQDGTETWMIYVASSDVSDIIGSSRVRIEKITWDKTIKLKRFPVVSSDNATKTYK